MAYFRPSQMIPVRAQFGEEDKVEEIEDSKQKKAESNGPRNVYILGLDISNCTSFLQYIIIVGGFMFFMCFYGYYQELVVYGWFQRKLSLFSTFLHFLGCSIFAQIQKNMSRPSNQHVTRMDLKQRHALTMGTASFPVGIFYYALIVLLKTASQGLSNLSMSHINYTAKVLFKSAQPVVTIVIGTCWFRRSYPAKDYVIVVLLMVGLAIFITGRGSSPESTTSGLVYVTFSMLGSAAVPMVHEHVITTYNASVDDLTYHSFLGSTIVSLILAIVTHEFMQGMYFLWASGSIHTWFVFIAFTSFGFIGAVFGVTLTSQYGALVNGITNTFRKALTLILSFVLFPERNELTVQKIVGAAIFFTGLIVQLLGQTKYMQYLCSCSSSSSSSSINSGGGGGDGSGKLFSGNSRENPIGLGSSSDNCIKGESDSFDLEGSYDSNGGGGSGGTNKGDDGINLEWEAFNYGQNIDPNPTTMVANKSISGSNDGPIHTPKGNEPISPSVYKRFSSSNSVSNKTTTTNTRSATTNTNITTNTTTTSSGINSGAININRAVGSSSYYHTHSSHYNNTMRTLMDEEETRSDDLNADTYISGSSMNRDTSLFLSRSGSSSSSSSRESHLLLNGDSSGRLKYAI